MQKAVKQKSIREIRAKKALAMSLCFSQKYQLDPAEKRFILAGGDEWDVQAAIVLDLLRQAGYHIVKTPSDK